MSPNAHGLFEPQKTDSQQVVLAGSFEDLLENGWDWSNLIEYTKEKIVWTSKKCSILRNSWDPPAEHAGYSIDMIVRTTSKKDQIKEHQAIHIHSVDAISTADTIQGLLSLCSVPSKTLMVDSVTLKCFATSPRKALANLTDPLVTIPSTATQSSSFFLSLQFLSVDETTCHLLLRCPYISHLEFRQCSTSDGDGLQSALLNTNTLSGPSKLSISCTMPDFSKLAHGFSCSSSIQELTLQLHFWLQGPALSNFTQSMLSNRSLTKLSIEYLDMTDDGWKSLCACLKDHPALTHLYLDFTEKFVDTFRKLTPERRKQRSQAIWDLVLSNSNLRSVKWPKCQHDEAVESQVQANLEERNRPQKKAKVNYS